MRLLQSILHPNPLLPAESAVKGKTRSSLRWHGSNDSIRLHGHEIACPLTYSCSSGESEEPSALQEKLRVTSHGSPDILGYWPSYSEMTPRQRHVYLEWMASGRASMPMEIGYAFVFFYGLERRVLAQQLDHALIFDEVARLRAAHLATSEKISRSFLGYTGRLLWLLAAKDPMMWREAHIRPLIEDTHGIPQELFVAIYWCATHHEQLPEWLAYSVVKRLPTAQHGISSKHAAEEMRLLFSERYREKWPIGLPLRPQPPGALKKIGFEHYTASAALGKYQHEFTLPQKLGRSLVALAEVWNDCSNSLRPYAKLVSTTAHKGIVHQAQVWEALPALLRKGAHPATSQLAEKVGAILKQQKFAAIPISHLIVMNGLPEREKYSREQSSRLAQTLEYCGYAIEPDARLSEKGYRLEEHVAVFAHDGEPINKIRYNAACLMLRLGLAAATANGKPDAQQLNLLAGHILNVFQLQRNEQKRMEALANILLTNGVDMVSTRELVQQLQPAQREAIGRLLIAIAAHDGVITTEEMKTLRAGFERLGLGKASLDLHLSTLRAVDNLTIVQRTKKRTAGEKIPASAEVESIDTASIQLDANLIAALIHDTREVQEALSRAMAVDDESAVESTPSSPEAEPESKIDAPMLLQPDSFSGGYQPLFQELVLREVWPLPEASALARKHGQMLEGALEAINDWSVENLGSPLFYEEGDCLIVEKDLLN